MPPIEAQSTSSNTTISIQLHPVTRRGQAVTKHFNTGTVLGYPSFKGNFCFNCCIASYLTKIPTTFRNSTDSSRYCNHLPLFLSRRTRSNKLTIHNEDEILEGKNLQVYFLLAITTLYIFSMAEKQAAIACSYSIHVSSIMICNNYVILNL